MHEHPLIELYISVGDEQQNTSIEQMLSSANIDDIVLQTLRMAGITQQIMLTVLVTDDENIRDLNNQYRQQNKPTDILSFPLQEKPLVKAPADQLWTAQEAEEIPLRDGDTENGEAAVDTEQPKPTFVTPPGMVMNLGDVMISWPTVVRQALEADHSPIYELLYLLSHGVLHLIGYDDQTDAGYQAMVHIQQTVLQASGQKA